MKINKAGVVIIILTSCIIFSLLIRSAFTPKAYLNGNTIHVSLDGSIKIVEKFLKETYLNDADSYENVKWGKLINNNDHTYQVYHSFRAKNAFGAYMLHAMAFTLSSDGEQVLEYTDDNGTHETSPDAVYNYKNKCYLQSDFTNKGFSGYLTENINGLNETCTVSGNINKTGDRINGTLIAVEKNVTYLIDGTQTEFGQYKLDLKNKENGSIIPINAHLNYKQLSGEFYEQTNNTQKLIFNLTPNN